VAGCSFGFLVRSGGDRWEKRGGKLVRELLDADLKEITLTSDPAYADTSIAMRSRAALLITDTRNLWLETC
jgi:phage head maturation protease